MYSKIIIIFLIASAFGKVISSWKDNDDHIKDLGWLFDVENNEVDAGEPTVCETNDCKSLAKEFLSGMNESVNPCDDFYEFICGSWKSKNPIPPYTAVWGRPFLFQEIVYRRIKGILEEKPKPEDILPVRQAKKWYRSCMNVEALERRGLKPLESILMQVGGWPMTIDAEEWDETDHSWQRIEQHYFQITGSYVFYKVEPVWFNDTLVELLQGSLPLINKLPFTFSNYTGDEYEHYKDFISSVTQMFVEHNSANITHQMIDKDVRDLIAFEKRLYEIIQYDEEKLKTIDDFQNWYDEQTEDKGNKINVKKLIKRVFEMVGHDTESIELVRSDTMDYFVKLNELLNETPKRTIVNYIHWHFVSSVLDVTTEKMRDIFFKLMIKEFGVKAREPRWLECTKEMKMTKATAYAFTQKYYTEKTDQRVRKMVDNIRKEMRSQIENSNWLDDETKRIATDKLAKMGLFVGTPHWYKNITHVLNSYKGLVIGVDHFDNVLSYRKYETRQDLRNVLTGRQSMDDYEEELLSPLIVNAGYEPYSNLIALPAADFQPPFFTEKLPHNINYGMSGTVIGHEIGHAYDIEGIRIGFEEESIKVSKQIMDMYYKRAECFLDQFNTYYGVTEPEYEDTTPFYGRGSFGRKTRSENMADTTGLHAVFEAYKTMLKKNGPDNKLPGFEKYSDEQMFFIAFGGLWCTHATKEYEEKRKASDVHSPGNLRVIGAVSNTNDFARVFNCPKNSPMNPENKCNIWKSIDQKKDKVVREHKKRKHPWTFDW